MKAGLVEICTNCVCLGYNIPYNLIPTCSQLILDLYSQINLSYVSGSENRYMTGMTYDRYDSPSLWKWKSLSVPSQMLLKTY